MSITHELTSIIDQSDRRQSLLVHHQLRIQRKVSSFVVYASALLTSPTFPVIN
jgi:hypothetical protein